VLPPQDVEEELPLLLGRSVVLLCMDVRRRRRLLALRSFFCESLLAMVLVWSMERERIYRLANLRPFRDPDDEHLCRNDVGGDRLPRLAALRMHAVREQSQRDFLVSPLA
jgi:hypothetical protein